MKSRICKSFPYFILINSVLYSFNANIYNVLRILKFDLRVIATPGRLLHVVVEMNFRLAAVKIIVFDEADRLFEMGFAEQLHVSFSFQAFIVDER